eukprot:g80237.t1
MIMISCRPRAESGLIAADHDNNSAESALTQLLRPDPLAEGKIGMSTSYYDSQLPQACSAFVPAPWQKLRCGNCMQWRTKHVEGAAREGKPHAKAGNAANKKSSATSASKGKAGGANQPTSKAPSSSWAAQPSSSSSSSSTSSSSSSSTSSSKPPKAKPASPSKAGAAAAGKQQLSQHAAKKQQQQQQHAPGSSKSAPAASAAKASSPRKAAKPPAQQSSSAASPKKGSSSSSTSKRGASAAAASSAAKDPSTAAKSPQKASSQSSSKTASSPKKTKPAASKPSAKLARLASEGPQPGKKLTRLRSSSPLRKAGGAAKSQGKQPGKLRAAPAPKASLQKAQNKPKTANKSKPKPLPATPIKGKGAMTPPTALTAHKAKKKAAVGWACGLCFKLNRKSGGVHCAACGALKSYGPAQAEDNEAGLYAHDLDGVKVALGLRWVLVEAEVQQAVGTVRLHQVFYNSSEFCIEGRYIFPLEERAAVFGFKAEIDGATVVGQVKAKEQALQEYKSAVARGDGAYLMQQQNKDVFEIRVGNIPAQATVLITVDYVCELLQEGGKLLFCLPGSLLGRLQHKLEQPMAAMPKDKLYSILSGPQFAGHHKKWRSYWGDAVEASRKEAAEPAAVRKQQHPTERRKESIRDWEDVAKEKEEDISGGWEDLSAPAEKPAADGSQATQEATAGHGSSSEPHFTLALTVRMPCGLKSIVCPSHPDLFRLLHETDDGADPEDISDFPAGPGGEGKETDKPDQQPDQQAANEPAKEKRTEQPAWLEGSRTALARLESPALLKTDLTVCIAATDMEQPLLLLEEDKAQRSLALLFSFVPNLDVSLSQVNSEMIFLVDCSGSMQREGRIKHAVNTLLGALQCLPLGVYFNIVCFGTDYSSLYDKSELMTNETRIEAVAHTAYIRADMGGTDLLKPLSFIFKTAPVERCARQLFVLTDGAVRNTKTVLKCVRAQASSCRIFSFGIGQDASRKLCDGLARNGGGKAAYVYETEHMREAVSQQVQDASRPAVTGLRVLWRGLPAVQQPFALKPMFHQTAYRFYALVQGTAAEVAAKHTQLSRVELRGCLPNGRPVSFKWAVDWSTAKEGKMVHTLAAREAIRDLEEETSEMHVPYPLCYQRTLAQLLKVDGLADTVVSYFLPNPAEKKPYQYELEGCPYTAQQIRARIRELGLRHQLASSATSFIAIEHRTEEQREKAKRDLAARMQEIEKRKKLSSVSKLMKNEEKKGAKRATSGSARGATRERASKAADAAAAPAGPAAAKTEQEEVADDAANDGAEQLAGRVAQPADDLDEPGDHVLLAKPKTLSTYAPDKSKQAASSKVAPAQQQQQHLKLTSSSKHDAHLSLALSWSLPPPGGVVWRLLDKPPHDLLSKFELTVAIPTASLPSPDKAGAVVCATPRLAFEVLFRLSFPRSFPRDSPAVFLETKAADRAAIPAEYRHNKISPLVSALWRF